jgi:hypothetical protein
MKGYTYLLKKKTAAYNRKHKKNIQDDIYWIKNFLINMELHDFYPVNDIHKQN